ncbi:hypothetical protein NEOLI_001012 [Neolecta irregularis DAH-3]|uniref:AB hydrolase-1 domain-containing protein n=1 Tax=Neolecta irregularis (strain DAH-3) TaxID=1198029 RepID=A0A1U7LW29_NEOID|nr:hypothetical protein NEOLI_001012 [Neolecta irregularis DAH-3]|eukprot:OLL26829.1 hypothetical protein NEOLI_001012 [Neolecta irregularis DAH-3]
MAHSLGCAYALATALLLPHFIIGSIHLLAPFIPTTQIKICKNHGSKQPNNITSLPTSQKLLSFLPTPILRAANSLLGPNTNPSSGTSDELNTAIWNAATCTNTTSDLLTVLEKPHPLGFRYIDIDAPCIFYGGTKDTKIPIERIKWMGERMKDCSVRVLNGLGHSLLSNARVLGEVLEGIRDESRIGVLIVLFRGVFIFCSLLLAKLEWEFMFTVSEDEQKLLVEVALYWMSGFGTFSDSRYDLGLIVNLIIPEKWKSLYDSRKFGEVWLQAFYVDANTLGI